MLARRLRAAANRSTMNNEILFVTALSQSGSGTFTFSGTNLGTPFLNRRVVLVVSVLSNNPVPTPSGFLISSVTLAGNNASPTRGGYAMGASPIYRAIGFYEIVDSINSSATIQVTLAGAGSDHCIIHVYSVATTKNEVQGEQDPSSPFQITRTFTVNSLALYAGISSDTATTSWTNATQRASTAISGQFRLTTATYYPTLAETRTVTFTPSTTTNAALYFAGW
jgi:hypothetical protein